jgi:hypothetical protein
VLRARLTNARLVSYAIGGVDTLDAPFRIVLEFERDGAAMSLERSLVVLPELVWPAPPLDEDFQSDHRVHPVVLDCLRTYRDRLRITPPPGYRASGPVEPASFNGRYFAFTLGGSVEGEELVLERSFENRALVVPARGWTPRPSSPACARPAVARL